ncbi:heavy metal-associated isoprenylated plant protein 3-like [Lycium ferocissimum]|uniref:heavy metal-associated isoprenylated plant protein 3-like n=1 Tax=Lycium ferocissimum TaxID=112874 RepID=UPI0028165600|nr:heavy metal-associated isoprenylated plant protein 3-like [Lycium ferocissimum]XP_059314671.1 heavy metal-associated isoprenylated plant protein 3-like [Lycium ferocissimum]XP_059314672.1 heavy metal-associated isoprenylated plant protein 3-like [Lycium ferocissimum]
MCDADSKKLTVIGKVDPVMLREKVEQKTHKHVELVSPIPKKDGKDGKGKDGSGGGGGGGGGEEKKKQNNKENDSKKENKGEDKKTKEKEPPITTAVLKVHLHCQGCIQKIQKMVTKFKGYKEMKIDRQKDLVTVTGSIDMKELAETLKKHLKKEVEIVPQKKEGGDKKEKGGGDGGGETGKGGGGGKGKGKGKGGEGGGEGKGKLQDEVVGDGGFGGGEMIMRGNVGNGMQMMQQQVQFGYPYPYMYGPVGSVGPVGPVYPGDQFQNPYPVSVHAPQLFSDENPNACSVM